VRIIGPHRKSIIERNKDSFNHFFQNKLNGTIKMLTDFILVFSRHRKPCIAIKLLFLFFTGFKKR